MINSKLSIVIPAKNEEKGLTRLLPEIIKDYPNAEVIVVNDSSTDQTEQICQTLGVKLINHPYSKGNGAAIKTGARTATGDIIVFMDGDGQHHSSDIALLLNKIESGYDMVVGARNFSGQASIPRSIANIIYNTLSSWITGHKIKDLTSGFRAVKRTLFMEFYSLLPNGFSYPTTSTMAFFRTGYSVCYVPINISKRTGKSHLSIFKDGIRFFLIIFKVGTLYSPLKIFFPISFSFFITGILYYLYTYWSDGRFTNMGVLLLTTSVLVFLIGLISEQITTLLYKDTHNS